MLAILSPLFGMALATPQLPFSPPLTIAKYDTMQSRRVEVVIEWAGDHGSALRAAAASRIVKELFADCKVRVTPLTMEGPAFRLRCDGKLVVFSDVGHPSAYLPIKRIEEAVSEARKFKRPPTTVYHSSVESHQLLLPTDVAQSKRIKTQRRARRRRMLVRESSPNSPR